MFSIEKIKSSLPSLAMEYIGNKRTILEFVTKTIVEQSGDGPCEILDLFSGTGIVSASFKAMGYHVFANDHLATCFNLTAAILLNNRPPSFSGLIALGLKLPEVDTYKAVLTELNNLAPKPGGFVHLNFSPASYDCAGMERRYFSETNAQKIDAIREKIDEWRQYLTDAEYSLLISDLVRSVSAVSNVAGTFGCYLKNWKERALLPIVLTPSIFIDGPNLDHEVYLSEAAQAITRTEARIVYADPPYTKRQYAAYYHVLETIVRNDKPKLVGSTGLRKWEEQASDFCYKRKAPAALDELLRKLRCSHFFLSYSEDGHMQHEHLLEILKSYGEVSFREIALRRYRSSNLPHKGPFVAERLYHLVLN